MLKSMTAFGRGTVTTSSVRFVVEIQSLNRKYLECDINLPRELAECDSDIRKVLTSGVHRGKVSVRISPTYFGGLPVAITPNLAIARELKGAWETISKDLSLEQPFNLDWIVRCQDLFSWEQSTLDLEALKKPLFEALSLALDGLVAMRQQEGEELFNDIVSRLRVLENAIDKIEALSSNSVNAYREKITTRLEELLPSGAENEERILREVCLFADKLDTTEEITRFRSHLKQFHELLLGGKNSVGKTLDFLAQELFREANTIASKSSDVEVSHLIVAVKGELEKVREQIQNVE